MNKALSVTDGGEKDVETVHIDTSLQIERCKAKNKSEIVESALRDIPFKSTSSFARYEFRQAWLKDLGYLYSQSEGLSRPEDLLGIVNDKLNAYSGNRRRVSRCLQGIVRFLGQVPDTVSLGAALVRLRSHLRTAIMGAYAWWESSVTHEFDGTSCARARKKPISIQRRIDVSCPRCRPNKVECSVHTFFAENEDRFRRIRSFIEQDAKASPELMAARDVIDRALQDKRILCDDRECRALGDVLIAVDGAKMSSYAANNDKEWELLAKSMGKSLLNPVREEKG